MQDSGTGPAKPPGSLWPRPRTRGMAAAVWQPPRLARQPCQLRPGVAAGSPPALAGPTAATSPAGAPLASSRAITSTAFLMVAAYTPAPSAASSIWRLAVKSGRDIARLYQGDADAERGDFIGDRLSESLQRELAGTVISLVRDADDAADRADQHDAAARLGAHGRQCRLHHAGRSPRSWSRTAPSPQPMLVYSAAPATPQPAAATTASSRLVLLRNRGHAGRHGRIVVHVHGQPRPGAAGRAAAARAASAGTEYRPAGPGEPVGACACRCRLMLR